MRLIDWMDGSEKRAGFLVRKVYLHLAGAYLIEQKEGHLHPLKIKNSDGFHLAHMLDRPSAIFLDFFTPA